MTKEEAIIILENEQPSCSGKITFSEEKRYEAYNMAIELLKRECPCIDKTYIKWMSSNNPPTNNGNYIVTFGYFSYDTGISFWDGEQWDIKSTVHAWAEFPQPCEISEVFI